MRNYLRAALVFACAAHLASCAHGPAGARRSSAPEPLLTDGVAEYNPRNLAATRAAAALDAQKEALRRAARLYAEASDRAAQERDPLSYGTPQRLVPRHKIVSERVEGQYYRVTVRSWVDHARLAAAMRGAGAAGRAGAAAALLASDPQGAGFSKSFRLAMARRGVLLVDELSSSAAEPGANDEDALSAARASGADLLLRASVSVSQAGAGLNTGFFPCNAEAALRVLDASTGGELLALSKQASAVDSSQAGAYAKAAASAAELLAQELSSKADRLVRQDAPVRILVAGLSGLEQLEALKEGLSRLDVKRLWLEDYSDGAAVFLAVPRRPDTQELASAVLRGDVLRLELDGVSPREIRFFASR